MTSQNPVYSSDEEAHSNIKSVLKEYSCYNTHSPTRMPASLPGAYTHSPFRISASLPGGSQIQTLPVHPKKKLYKSLSSFTQQEDMNNSEELVGVHEINQDKDNVSTNDSGEATLESALTKLKATDNEAARRSSETKR